MHKSSKIKNEKLETLFLLKMGWKNLKKLKNKLTVEFFPRPNVWKVACTLKKP